MPFLVVFDLIISNRSAPSDSPVWCDTIWGSRFMFSEDVHYFLEDLTAPSRTVTYQVTNRGPRRGIPVTNVDFDKPMSYVT